MHGHVKFSYTCSFSAVSLDTRSSDLDRSSGRVLFRAVSTCSSDLDYSSGHGHVSPAVCCFSALSLYTRSSDLDCSSGRAWPRKSRCACSFSVLYLYTRSSDLDRSPGRGAVPCCLYIPLLLRLFWPWSRKSSRLQIYCSVSLYTLL